MSDQSAIDTGEQKLEIDEEFETFLRSRNPSKFVERLARADYYDMDAFKALYPEDAVAPPEFVNEGPKGPTGPTHFVRLRYSIETSGAALAIVKEFITANPERRQKYISYSYYLARKRRGK